MEELIGSNDSNAERAGAEILAANHLDPKVVRRTYRDRHKRTRTHEFPPRLVGLGRHLLHELGAHLLRGLDDDPALIDRLFHRPRLEPAVGVRIQLVRGDVP